jgi:hypothetical protein
MQTLGICIRWGKGSHLSGDRNTEEQREGIVKTTHNDSPEGTGGIGRSETSGWQAEGSAHPRAGRTHSKSDRGFMTIRLSPADAPCRVTAGDVNHNQTDGGR